MTHYLLGQVDDRQPASLKLSRGWIYSLGMTIALAIAYFLAARLSLFLLTEPDGVAVFWPAAGVSAGALIGSGRGTVAGHRWHDSGDGCGQSSG